MFPTFPEFLPLSLELKDAYNEIVDAFPPYSDFSFATLQIWWNLSENLSVSLLNQNLVIDYNLPFDADNSGLSLVGKNEIDASIDIIFRHLGQANKKVRLVHVPEFVVNRITNPDAFSITEEHDYNEYILDSQALAKLEGPEYKLLRKKIKRFVRTVGEKELEFKALDLELMEVQDELFKSIADWEASNATRNDPEHDEHQALRKAFGNASRLGLDNLALYINKKLHGVVIFHRPMGREYYVLHHLKANYETPYVSDYLYHQMAKKAVSNQVSGLNIEMDLGIENLKKHKLTLRPAYYFRKFTITPA